MNTTTNDRATVSEGCTDGQSDLLAAFFLDRLQRLLALRPTDAELSEDEATRLVRHAIYATYRDLQGLGRECEARRLLAASRHRRPVEWVGVSPHNCPAGTSGER
jgi:hypothetical protein